MTMLLGSEIGAVTSGQSGRTYWEMLFTSPGIAEFISGVTATGATTEMYEQRPHWRQAQFNNTGSGGSNGNRAV
jgi:hypothetical protein